jgi:hypothetical protein
MFSTSAFACGYPLANCDDAVYYQPVAGNFEQQQTVNFLGSLSQIISMRGQPAGSGLALGNGVQQGMAAGGGDTRWNVWGAANYTSFGYSFQPMKSSGHGDAVFGGIDYTFGNNIILGTAVTLERSRIGTDFNNGHVRGDGHSIAPYIAIPLNNNWTVDATIGVGKTNLDSTVSGVTESVDDKRTFRALSLSYFREYQRWQFVGKGSYLASEDHFSQTATAPSSHFRMEQLRLGAQAGYDMGTAVPFFATYYISDIGSSRQPSAGGQNPANDRDAWQIQLGVNLGGRGPVSGGVTLFSELSRSQVRNDAILANIAYRF